MPEVRLNIPDNIYRVLVDRASKAGYRDVSEYLLHIISSMAEAGGAPDISKYVEDTVAKHVSRVERKLSDVVNAYTARVEELASKIASLHEELDEIKSRIEGFEERLREREEREAREERREAQQTRRATAIDILKQQKVFYESSIYGKIKNRDKFFQKLEREGAVIISTDRERIAIDRDFWNSFTSKLSRIHSDSEEIIRGVLSDRREIELFEKLKDSGIVIYDATEKRWKLVE